MAEHMHHSSRQSSAPCGSRPAWPLSLVIAGALALLDQIAKHYFSGLLDLGAAYPVTSFFNLVHARNFGASFSFLSNAGGWQRYFFIIIGASAGVFLCVLIIRSASSRIETCGYAAILAGALGNTLDRVRLGYVVDFLDIYWRTWHWPAFNLADTYITFGVVCILLAPLFPPTRPAARR